MLSLASFILSVIILPVLSPLLGQLLAHGRHLSAGRTKTRPQKNLIISLLIASLMLVGCSGYRSYGGGAFGGFREDKLAPDLYHVYFLANGYTSDKRAATLTLLRTADIAQQLGRPYFTIVTTNKVTDSNAITYRGRVYYPADPSSDNIVIMLQGATLPAAWLKAKAKNGVKKSANNTAPKTNYIYSTQKICDSLAPNYDTACGAIKIKLEP